MSVIGYKLLITGIPYDFLTGPAMTIAAGDPGDFGEDTDVVQAPHFLDWPDLQFTVAAKPIDGDMEVDGIEVLVHDARVDTGIAAGYPIMSWLAGRDATSITSSPLISSLTPSATDVFVNTASFPSSGFAWIEQEAIHYTGKTINKFTGVTRGVLGTVAAAHTIDALSGRQPEVFAAPPWIFQRRATLWAIDGQGKGGITSRRVYSGVIRVPPSLHEDGARWSIRLEHLWGAIKEAQPTREFGRVEFTGVSCQPYPGAGGAAAILSLFAYRVSLSETFGVSLNSGPSGYWPNLETAARQWGAMWRAWVEGSFGHASVYSARRDGRALTIETEYQDASTPTGQAVCVIASRPAQEATATLRRIDRGGVIYWHATHVFPDAPRVLHVMQVGVPAEIPVRQAYGLPTGSWTGSVTTDDGRQTALSYNLRVPYDENWYVDFGAVTVNTSTITATPTVTPRKRPPSSDAVQLSVSLTDPQPAQVIAKVVTDHWVEGVRYALSPLLVEAHQDDWDFGNIYTTIWGTGGMNARRTWTFTGEERVGPALVEACQLTGCTPTVINGRVGFLSWFLIPGGIVVSDAATFGPESIVGDSPHWEGWREGLVNRFKLTRGEDLTISVTDARSLNRYGQGREVVVELTGVDAERLGNVDPQSLYRQLLSGMGRWSEPLAMVRLQAPVANQWDFELGTIIKVQNDWRVPNGAGGRGLTEAFGRVVAITYDTGVGDERVFVMDVLIFNRRSRAYGPSARVNTRTGTTQLNITNTQVRGGAYSGGGTDDALQFTNGDEIELVVRGVRASERMTNTVSSVSAGVINLGTALTAAMQYWIDNASTLGVWVSVRLRDYSASTSDQKAEWAWIGSEITSVIDATTDPLHTFAP